MDSSRPSQASFRSSHRSSTTPSSDGIESFRLSLTESAVDYSVDDYHPASTWNPICSIQSSGFNFSAEELEAIDQLAEVEDDSFMIEQYRSAEVENSSFEDPIASAKNSSVGDDDNGGDGTIYRGQDPPEISEAMHALVPWEEKAAHDDSNGFRNTDNSGTTEEMSDPPSDASDVEPCEEHYRIPPAKEEVLHQEIICRTDPPDVNASIGNQSKKEELIHRINTQLALVPTSKYNGYRHHFITVKEHHRFLLLYNFLKRNLRSKIIVYFSTTKSTQYHGKLLQHLQFDVNYVHNGQSKEKFLHTYLEFSKQKRGILCLPDFQGKELAVPPSISWIVQYEPPDDPSEYIFRVGRISSERSSSKGKALVFLTPHQFQFLAYFKAAHVKIYEYEMHNLNNVQRYYEKLVRKDERLSKMSRDAYHSFLLNYASHDYRDVYDVHLINRDKVAQSFGFERAPSPEKERGESSKKISAREDNRWKPSKRVDSDSWMGKKEKTWRYADRHSHLMKKSERR